MTTKIEWAEKTWNPITGCTKISEGCKNCYAERLSKRLVGRYGYPKDEPFRVTFHPDRLDQPAKWRKSRRVFVCSMGDLFHDDVPFQNILDVFVKMVQYGDHQYLVLTKRPKRMLEFFDAWEQMNEAALVNGQMRIQLPLRNVWLGVTAENQAAADERIPLLLQTPAAKRFVSVEPMLGMVDLHRYRDYLYYTPRRFSERYGYKHKLDWVICGGETGPGARPMDPEWARSLRDQCKESGVPFFMKKMSGGAQPPDDLMIREYPNGIS